MAGLSKDSAADLTRPCRFIYGESSTGKLAADAKLFARSLTRTVVRHPSFNGRVVLQGIASEGNSSDELQMDKQQPTGTTV